jgi:hypothetical protein
MKKRYQIGDKVKLSPDSEYVCQSGGTIGKIIEFRYTLPKKDDDFDQTKYYYRVQFENGESNSYRYTDLIPAEEETIKKEAVERFGFISKNDKFTIFDEDCDRTIREEDPANWTICSDGLYLATFGQGGLCLYKDGQWAERTSLPKNWTVKCSFHVRDQPELLEWKKSVNEVEWPIDGWIDNSGAWSDNVAENKGIITYNQFIKWVYNPWKSLQSSTQVSSMEKEWKPKFKIGDRVRAISQSHGWGCVDKGDIGTIIRKSSSFEEEDVYFVDFGEHKSTYWKGHESCFELVEESIQGEFVYSPLSSTDSEYKLQLGDIPLVRVITTNGISSEFKNEQSINLSIYKSKKVKQLKL